MQQSILQQSTFLQAAQSNLAELVTALKALKAVPLSCMNKERTALVIVDMINGFVREGPLSSSNALAIQPDIAALLLRCTENSIKSVFFTDSHTMESPEFSAYPVHCLQGSDESAPTRELAEIGGFTIIEKNSTNGFLEPAFQQWLKENTGIDTFLVVGCCTDICVQQFALTLKMDFNRRNLTSRVIVPMSMSSTYDLPGHDAALTDLFSFYNMLTNGIEVTPDLTF